MRGMGFAKGIGAKGMAAKGGLFKGIFGFFGGIFKMLFFGFFLLIFLIVGLVVFFFMRKKINEGMKSYKNSTPSKNDDIIDAEIIENYPAKR